MKQYLITNDIKDRYGTDLKMNIYVDFNELLQINLTFIKSIFTNNYLK